jgi:hypothetical protein
MTRAINREIEASDPVLEAEIRKRLDEVEQQLAGSVKTETPLISEAGRYLLSAGGKRFRPMLVLLGGHFGDPADPRLIPLAVAVELTHLASLYHDDVIDEAESRRGIPSVNARWDNTVAILAGDFLFARASAIAAELGTEVSRLLAVTIGRPARSARCSQAPLRRWWTASSASGTPSAWLFSSQTTSWTWSPTSPPWGRNRQWI